MEIKEVTSLFIYIWHLQVSINNCQSILMDDMLLFCSTYCQASGRHNNKRNGIKNMMTWSMVVQFELWIEMLSIYNWVSLLIFHSSSQLLTPYLLLVEVLRKWCAEFRRDAGTQFELLLDVFLCAWPHWVIFLICRIITKQTGFGGVFSAIS